MDIRIFLPTELDKIRMFFVPLPFFDNQLSWIACVHRRSTSPENPVTGRTRGFRLGGMGDRATGSVSAFDLSFIELTLATVDGIYNIKIGGLIDAHIKCRYTKMQQFFVYSIQLMVQTP
ncbi:hypothetical protein M1B72_16880 [Geomonas paludis]|uniref:Uncharacterized protein n=1 Tax=Geomonas paludis TaxID=2740185 RepID=A0A6V8N105_9BACT|nr:hypothetical protein [Geomonas paludis]UPU38346.1 hypothetical protein M1B72_16880 [Geomonas paludis]GFO65433.1 hypothetical protein GMPD_33520 [Geomonas paludis]